MRRNSIAKMNQLVRHVIPSASGTQAKVIRIHPQDNVLVALTDLRKGETIPTSDKEYVLQSDVSAKHKFATQDLKVGDTVVMYGVRVGRAVEVIRAGEAVTTRNTKHDAATGEGRTATYHLTAPDVSRWKQQTFMGYRRSDGPVGTRNHWLVVPLVFCENRNVAYIKEAFEKELGFAPPQPYSSQVADLVKLYHEGKTKELQEFLGEASREDAPNHTPFTNITRFKFLLH